MNLIDPVRFVLKQKGQAVWQVAPDTCVYDAIELMAQKYIGAVLVISGNELVGVMSERDYARKVILQGKSSKETAVKEIMSSPAISVGPEQSVEACMRIMTERHIRHLPIVQGSDIMGVVSIGDLVKWMITAQQLTITHLQDYISSKYPG